jgi:hypothetical protein
LNALKLSPTLTHAPGESPQSLVSRLARLHQIESASQFCRDMGLTFQQVIDGNPETLAAIAMLSGNDVGRLQYEALQRRDDEFSFRGERLLRHSLRRARLHVCPSCMLDDIRSSGGARSNAVVGRTTWLLEPITTCREHGLELFELQTNAVAQRVHDFARLVEPFLTDLPRMAAEALPCDLPAHESYLLDRLDGQRGQCAMLDQLDWFAAGRLCVVLGAVALNGRNISLREIEGGKRRAAGHRGYEIALQGQGGIRALLQELQGSFCYSTSSNDGPKAIFGTLYEWLAFDGGADTAYEPIRCMVSSHIHQTMPVGPGDEVFGKPFPSRKLHSIRTASLEMGAHPKRLRKVLAQAKLIPSDHAAMNDHRVLFDAAASQSLLSTAQNALSLADLESYMGATRSQARLLVDQGFIRPFVSPTASIRTSNFARAELDAFLDKLLEGEPPDANSGARLCPIDRASKRATCGQGEVLRLILDGKLASLRVKQGERRLSALLVDPDEVRAHVRGPDLDGLPSYKVAKLLGTSDRVVKSLTALGVLPIEKVINPLNRCPVEIVTHANLSVFRREYVTLFQLSAESGGHHLDVQNLLESKGIQPAFNPAEVGCRIYLRSHLD